MRRQTPLQQTLQGVGFAGDRIARTEVYFGWELT